MHCPICPETALVLADRQGIEIDYCPKCRGVWLDRGELDKIIERSTAIAAPPGRSPDEQRRGEETRRYRDDDHHRAGYRRKRKSFLDDIFDF